MQGPPQCRPHQAVLFLAEGMSCQKVGRLPVLDDDTVRGHGKRYLSGGAEGLLGDGRKGRDPMLSPDGAEEPGAHLSGRAYFSTLGVIAHIEGAFGKRYSRSGAAKLLRRMGYRYKKPKKVPARADVAEQLEFKGRYGEISENLGPDDRIMFMDGVHPTHNSVPAHGWFKKGGKAHLPANTGRRRTDINGALDIANKQVSTMECERIDAEAVIKHFGLLLEQFPKGKIYIVPGNARYHGPGPSRPSSRRTSGSSSCSYRHTAPI